MRITVPVRDPRPGAPWLRKGPWSLAVATPGTFARLPEGGAYSRSGFVCAPGQHRPSEREMQRLVDHIANIDGALYDADHEARCTRSLVYALLSAGWWLRADVAAAIDQLRLMSARVS